MPIPSAAANAYASIARLTDPQGFAKPGGESPSGSSFGSMLKDAIGSLNQTARAADGQAQTMASGKGNIVDVVTAVAESEVAINTLVSVRDKVISAYEEIMKMPI